MQRLYHVHDMPKMQHHRHATRKTTNIDNIQEKNIHVRGLAITIFILILVILTSTHVSRYCTRASDDAVLKSNAKC